MPFFSHHANIVDVDIEISDFAVQVTHQTKEKKGKK